MDESKQSLLYMILDKATPPTMKSRPKRSLNILVALLGSFVFSSLLVILSARFIEARERFQKDRTLLGV
jgi:uncharacterized protein involved in exopolysaccharide biosynthesis